MLQLEVDFRLRRLGKTAAQILPHERNARCMQLQRDSHAEAMIGARIHEAILFDTEPEIHA
jgi:hypothetical protein